MLYFLFVYRYVKERPCRTLSINFIAAINAQKSEKLMKTFLTLEDPFLNSSSFQWFDMYTGCERVFKAAMM